MIALVAAVAENDVIGLDGELPWHLPDDLKFFKRLTSGHVVIMGRKTFETVGHALPDRWNVIVTRNPQYHRADATVVHSIEEALQVTRGADHVFVVGGSEIYRLALPYADRMYLTIVHGEFEGDTVFPEFDTAEWKLEQDERREADAKHTYAFSFRRYDRKEKARVP